MVKTAVHFPTDISLLYDAMRRVITLTARWCERYGLSDWRQYNYNIRHVKRQMRSAQNTKRSKAQSPELQEKNASRIVQCTTPDRSNAVARDPWRSHRPCRQSVLYL